MGEVADLAPVALAGVKPLMNMATSVTIPTTTARF
jgi:hypothetical protein